MATRDRTYLSIEQNGRVGSPGQLLGLIRSGDATTRAELAAATGLARSTISQRIDLLMADDLVQEVGEAPSTGGRPPAVLGFNHHAGVVLVADLGATHSRIAVSDLGGDALAEERRDIAIAEGPDTVLSWVEQEFDAMLTRLGMDASNVRGTGIGVPGPVEFAAGRTVHPPIMPGWDGYPIADRFADRYEAPALVDNDVNIMALGEHWRIQPSADDLFFVKMGTGIGSGMILGNHIHRGALGAAGDIGHVYVGPPDILCRCGNLGCLEATAGGGALADQLRSMGYDTTNSRDVVRLVRAGNTDAIQLIRNAGRLVGQVLAAIVNLLNPAVIMIGGDVAMAGEELMAGIRETVYGRSTALSTADLKIMPSSLGDRAGITGAAAMIVEHVLAPVAVDRDLSMREVAG
jgi:predicted NBD/HSP70 family sugar kinase